MNSQPAGSSVAYGAPVSDPIATGCASPLGKWVLTMVVGIIAYLIRIFTLLVIPIISLHGPVEGPQKGHRLAMSCATRDRIYLRHGVLCITALLFISHSLIVVESLFYGIGLTDLNTCFWWWIQLSYQFVKLLLDAQYSTGRCNQDTKHRLFGWFRRCCSSYRNDFSPYAAAGGPMAFQW